MVKSMRVLVMVLVMGSVFASTCLANWRKDGHEFPQTYTAKEGDLTLQGVGVKTIFMMRVFIAGLYLPKTMSDVQALGEVSKHLEVRFYAKIKSKAFADYTVGRIKANVTRAEFKELKSRFGELYDLFPDINPGDTLALTYVPGEGTVFTHNGQERGVLKGSELSRAVYATWIGKRPFDHIVKSQILGLNNG